MPEYKMCSKGPTYLYWKNVKFVHFFIHVHFLKILFNFLAMEYLFIFQITDRIKLNIIQIT